MTTTYTPDDPAYLKKQQEVLAGFNAQVGKTYEVPLTLEAATAILMQHVCEGTRLFSDSPWTWTRCQEVTSSLQNAVGGFAVGGLVVFVTDHDNGNGHVDLAAVWKFF